MPIDLSHQAAYEPRADAYAELLEPTLRGAAEKLAELAGAGPHMRLLDVATGTGSAARAAAAKGATVAAVDLSPAMVEVARRGSPASIEFRVADVHELPYSDDAFDAVVCGLALSHFREVTRALREIRRILRPDGRFVASYWGPGSAFPSYRAAVEILTRYAGGKLNSFEDDPDEDTWFHPERGSEILHRAGFVVIEVRTETFSGTLSSPEEAFAWAIAWPTEGTTAELLPSNDREAFAAEALAAIRSARDLSWRFAINYYVGRTSTASS